MADFQGSLQINSHYNDYSKSSTNEISISIDSVSSSFVYEFYNDSILLNYYTLIKKEKHECIMGPVIEFYPNGNLESLKFKNCNKIIGKAYYFNKQGHKIREVQFPIDTINILIPFDITYSLSGNHSGYIHELPDGLIKEWYSNGNIKFIKSFSKGLANGKWCFFYENGQLKEERYYSSDGIAFPVKINIVIEDLSMKDDYIADDVYPLLSKKVGVWKKWDKAGNLLREKQW